MAAAMVALALPCACGGGGAPAGPPPVGVSRPVVAPPVDFTFDSLDERPVSAEATRGKPTILCFITTSSLAAQAEVDFLSAMAKRDGDRAHYAAVLLSGRDERELGELYRKALHVPFPVALADAQTLAGTGAFGDVRAVPVTVILDRAGRVVWRVDGRVAKSDELRGALHGL